MGSERLDEIADPEKAILRGGKVAKRTREDIESQLGGTVISPLNASDKPALEVKNDKKKGDE